MVTTFLFSTERRPEILALLAGLAGVLVLLVALALRSRKSAAKAESAEGPDVHQSLTKDLRIKALFIHPIKSCRFIQVQESEYDLSGLRYDRTWLIVNADNHRFNTARDLPQMILIEPSLHPETNELRIRIPYSPTSDQATVVSTSQPF